ncbi:MAG: type 4a pilus biogenesis protein PilO [Candidatus Omnitrophica bacterium]|nr:type 4a pilus biogenesis protein PilO [Candidatus Omnitrophota bacterium]
MNVSISINKKILIVSIAILLLTFIGTKNFIYDPNSQRMQNRLKMLDEEYEKNRVFFEIKKIKDEINTYSKDMLAGEKDIPWLLGKISEIFNLLKIEVISMEPQPLEKTAFYTRLPVKVKTLCSYHTLGELLSRLEGLEKFVDITYLELRNFSGQDSGQQKAAAGEEGKPTSVRQRLDRRGFVLSELTIKLNALYLNQ